MMQTQTETQAAKPIRPAATLLLVRDGADGLEVLTVKRSKDMRAFPSFLAFPGGSVEQEDDLCARKHSVGAVAAAQLPDDAAFAVAALRETAEEIGWLGGLVRDAGKPFHTMISANLQSGLLHNKGMLCRELGTKRWKFDLSAMRFVGRWVTPAEVNIPVRFDTRFFIMHGFDEALPLRVHGTELDWAKWLCPKDLLQAIEDGLEQAALPTHAMLTALSHAPDVAWCLDHLSVGSPHPVT